MFLTDHNQTSRPSVETKKLSCILELNALPSSKLNDRLKCHVFSVTILCIECRWWWTWRWCSCRRLWIGINGRRFCLRVLRQWDGCQRRWMGRGRMMCFWLSFVSNQKCSSFSFKTARVCGSKHRSHTQQLCIFWMRDKLMQWSFCPRSLVDPNYSQAGASIP